MMLRKILTAFFLLSSSAQASQTTTNFLVSATVLSTCIVVALPLTFGNYSFAQLDSITTITVTCTPGVLYTVSLDLGTHASGSTRRLANGGNFLNYEIYQDPNRTTVWGTGANSVGGTSGLIPDILTVYGRIPAAQTCLAGAYTDTIGVTVNY